MRIVLASLIPDVRGLEAGFADQGILVDRAEEMDDLSSILSLSGPYDLVVIQAGNPLRGVQSALRDLRRRGHTLPVIVLSTAAAGPEEEEGVLHAGADDVVFQPFRLSVLHARMQAMSRRARGYASSHLSCGNVVLDQEQNRVTVDGRRVALTAREYDFLETMMLHKGVLMTKERFMSSLYADQEAPDSRIVDVFVCKLRRKLAGCGAAEMIRTVWGRGYVLFEPAAAAVAQARESAEPSLAEDPAPRGWVRRAPRFAAMRA
jgi:two-component system cell cycle response regulator CtrA